MPELSLATQKLISRYQAWHESSRPKEGAAIIHVDEVASKVAAFYEKIRGVIDWKEEHLLTRAAIERNLKRRLLLGGDGKDLAQPLISELIRGGYFPNDKIEEAKIEEVQRSIGKYLFLLQKNGSASGKKKINLYDWLLSIAACEVEEILDPQRKERALMDYMTEMMQERIKVIPEMPESEKNTQIFIAVQKALFKLDKPIISYHLLKKARPEWMDLPRNLQEEIAQNIRAVQENIEKSLTHPLAERFYRLCEKYDTPYLILGDVLASSSGQGKEILSAPQALELRAREAYRKRLSKMNSRAKRAALYSTVSIFLSKILIAFAFEIPFDKYVAHELNQQAIILSVILPPLLMFILVFTIRKPSKSNLEKLVLETISIVYFSEKKDSYAMRTPRKRGGFLNLLINTFYLATFIFSFGFLWWLLDKFGFGVSSKIIFLLFLSLISFAGMKVRERSKELIIEESKGGIFTFLLDSFSLPFIRIGKWLSGQWSRYNIIVVAFTALVDMPFQLFTEFLEQWRNFLKEKKEEIH